jgi:hypothetical protein
LNDCCHPPNLKTQRSRVDPLRSFGIEDCRFQSSSSGGARVRSRTRVRATGSNSAAPAWGAHTWPQTGRVAQPGRSRPVLAALHKWGWASVASTPWKRMSELQPWPRHQRREPLHELSGDITRGVVPSSRAVFSFSTTCTAGVALRPFVGQRRAGGRLRSCPAGQAAPGPSPSPCSAGHPTYLARGRPGNRPRGARLLRIRPVACRAQRSRGGGVAGLSPADVSGAG